MGSPRRTGNLWEITGWGSTVQIVQVTVPCAQISEVQLDALLQALVAKFGLTPREIVGSHLRRRAKGYMAHLEITKTNSDKRKSTHHSCGDNPYFIARVVLPRSEATVSSNSRWNGRAKSARRLPRSMPATTSGSSYPAPKTLEPGIFVGATLNSTRRHQWPVNSMS